MAQYDINFSTNASQIAKELGTVQSELAKVVRVLKPGGFSIKLDLNTADFTREIKSSFKELDQLISQIEKKLRSAKIGSPEFRLAAEQSGQLRGESQRGQMMARAISSRESAKAFDVGSLARYEQVLEGLRIQASLIAPNTQEWVNFQKSIGQITLELKQADKAAESIQLTQQLGALAPGSLSRLETQLTILKNRAREIKPNTDEWKRLNKEIQNVETSIQKVTKKRLSAGQRAGAAGGAFLYGGGMGGGVGSALGGIAGGLAGGVPGAFAGAAIGQVVDNLGQSLAAITSQASKVQQLQRGLALASIDAKDFAQAQAAVADVSARLFIPLEQVTKSFSQLRVNTKQYGLSVEETKQILEGTILAVSAFGGSADDVDGAMRAVVQILSKGSVQAEELRGQLGERFPGAVIKFAQANKLSFDELQSRLKEGTIGIKEFVTFAKDNYEDYAEFSKTIATAPEFAGRRLAKALEEMQMAIGQVFGSSGATIQDFASQALKDITTFVVNNKELLAQLGQDFAVVFSGIMSVVAEAGKFIIKVLAPVFSYIGGVIRQLRVMTGAADAATAKAEMNAANVIIQRTGMGRDAFLSGQPRPGSVADKIEFDKAQERYRRAEKRFKDAGGKAALPPETGTPPNLVFGGPGAGVNMTGDGGSEKPAKAPKAGKTRESELPLLALELATQEQIFQIESDIRSARLGGNNLEVIRLQGLQQQLKINQQIAELQLDKVTPANEKAVQLQLLLGKAEKERLDNTFEMESQIMQQYQAIQDAVIGIGTAADMELEGRKQYEALLREGMAPTLAKITAEVNQQFAIEKQKLTLLGSQIRDQILVLESKEALTKEDKEQLRILKERLALTEGGVSAIPGLAQGVIEAKAQTAAPKTTEAYLGEGLEEAQANLDKLTNTGYQVVQGANAIGDAFGTAFKDIASGSMTAQQALATMFQSIADHFLDMAAQMIAAWIKMAILNTVIKIFGSAASSGLSGGFGGDNSFSSFDAGGAQAFSSPSLSPGAAFAGGGATNYSSQLGGVAFNPTAFAEGGFVAGPTMGLIGEGGESEYVIPSSKMQSAMKRYSGGARGSAVIPANGESSEAGVMPTATGGAIDVRYTVERINTVDYVTADQFQRGMQQAASQGAQQGEKRALRQLQQNTSIRGRVGLR
jgi:tape measure domain-containing protein